MNTFYFLRHAKTLPDEHVPVSRWLLSEEGKKQVIEVGKRPEFHTVDVLISSSEDKALLTLKPLSEVLGKEIYQFAELGELDREKGGFMTPEKYEETTKNCLNNPGTSFEGWETSNNALSRFAKKVNEIDKQHQDRLILIAGHGHTLNLYFAKLLGKMDSVYLRLKSTGFCDWGIVKNGEVIKDLSK